MQTAGFRVAYRFPGLNDYTNANRIHWTRGRKLKKDAEEAVMWAIREARAHGRMPKIKPPYWILFEWHESSCRRDYDNVASAKKFVLDAMQKAGVIERDSQRYIAGFHDTFEDDSMDGLIVTIYSEEDGKRAELALREALLNA